MSVAERREFLAWYERHKEAVFDNRPVLEAYCQNDVTVLRQACLVFRQEFTRPVYKASDLWPEEIYYLGVGIVTLIPFKLGSLSLHKLAHRCFHCRKHFWKASFGMVFISAVAFCVISSLLTKRDPFNVVFNFGNNQK